MFPNPTPYPSLNPGHSAFMLQGKDVLTKEEGKGVSSWFPVFRISLLQTKSSRHGRFLRLPPLSNPTATLPPQTYLPQKFHGLCAERGGGT